MKKIFNPQTYIFLFSLIMLSLTQAIVFAQDSSASSSSSQTTTTTTQNMQLLFSHGYGLWEVWFYY